MVTQLLSPYLRRQIANRAKDAVNQSSINQEDVRSFQIRVPPRPLQAHWAKVVEAQRGRRDRMYAHRSGMEDLFSSLLHRAFSGEL